MEFVFRGDHLVLDFLNTEVRETPTRPPDLLVDTAALGQWFSEVGLPVEELAISPELLAQTKVFRAALRAIVAARVEDRSSPPEALAGVNTVLQAGTGYTTLEETDGELRRAWRPTEDTPLAPLLPLATAAVDLLTGEHASLIRQCGNPDCILYFLDTSKNHTRRWCSMDACGNRMKAAAHYRRKTGRGEDNETSGT